MALSRRSLNTSAAVGRHRANRARVVAGDALELDDVCAHRAQVHRDHGTGQEVAQVQHLEAAQGPRHLARRARPRAPSWRNPVIREENTDCYLRAERLYQRYANGTRGAVFFFTAKTPELGRYVQTVDRVARAPRYGR